MTLQEQYKDALNFVAQNINRNEEHNALIMINELHCPLSQASPRLYDQIDDLMEDYTTDHDLPRDWYYEFGDIEDIFWDMDD